MLAGFLPGADPDCTVDPGCVILPYRLVRSSKSYTLYERID